MRSHFASYYAARAARLAKACPTHWIIVPNGRDCYRIVRLAPDLDREAVYGAMLDMGFELPSLLEPSRSLKDGEPG